MTLYFYCFLRSMEESEYLLFCLVEIMLASVSVRQIPLFVDIFRLSGKVIIWFIGYWHSNARLSVRVLERSICKGI